MVGMPLNEGACQQILANVGPIFMLLMEIFVGREGGTVAENSTTGNANSSHLVT